MVTEAASTQPKLGRWAGRTRNWGRWPNDLGAVNLITSEVTMRGLGSVKRGDVIPLARRVSRVEPLEPTVLYQHDLYQDKVIEGAGTLPTHSAKEMLTFRVHNMVNTHVDAFAHIGYNGLHFNGHRHEEVVDRKAGAKRLDISNVLGVATRGVLMDVPRLRGVGQLDPADRVMPGDIEAFLGDVEPGDAVCIRTGATAAGGRRSVDSSGLDSGRGIWTGIHPDCIDLIADRGAAVLCGDSVEAFPSVLPGECATPVHVACLVVHGMPIVHSVDLESLADRCAVEQRRHFFFVVGALNTPGATGTPVAPIAIL